MASKAGIRIMLATPLILALALSAISAADPETSEPSPFAQAARTPEKVAAGKVYTNEDLQKMFGAGGSEPAPKAETPPPLPAPAQPPAPSGTAAPAPAPAPTAPQDPLQQLQEEQKRLTEKSQAIAKAEKKVADSEARVKDLEKRVLAAKNPFMARADVPADERQEWDKLNGTQRVNRSEEVLRQARQALTEAQEELRQLRSAP